MIMNKAHSYISAFLVILLTFEILRQVVPEMSSHSKLKDPHSKTIEQKNTMEHEWRINPRKLEGERISNFFRRKWLLCQLRGRDVLLVFFFFTRFNKLERTHLCTSWNMCSLESLWLLIVYSTLRPIWNTLTRTPSLLWSSSYRHRRDKLWDQYTSISNRR